MALGETTMERSDRLDKNQSRSLALLEEEGIIYKKFNPFHFLVDNAYDYWPRTGLFVKRKGRVKGRGIFNLIKKIKDSKNETKL